MKTNINSLFKCSSCELNFLSKEGMEKHYMRVHEGKGGAVTRFKCDKCNEEFDTKLDFKKHKAPQKFPCDGCKKKGQIFFAENKCEFTKHLAFFDFHKNDDIKNKKIITCTECKLEFQNSQLLKTHKNHTGKLACRKGKCKRVFFGTCKLERHMKFDQHNTKSSDLLKASSASAIIKPAVINLEKLKTDSESVKARLEKTKTNPPKLKPSPAFEVSELNIQPKSERKEKTSPSDVSLIQASKTIQKKTQKLKAKSVSALIKPAVINLEKRKSDSESVAKLENPKTNPQKLKLKSQKCKPSEAIEVSELSIQSKLLKKEESCPPDVSLIQASKMIQKKTQKLENIAKMTGNIQFHYQTYTDQELQSSGIFDESSSSFFLPPFLSDKKDTVAAAEDVEATSVLETVVDSPDTYEGVCILGF